MIENMEDLLFFVFLFVLTMGMVIVSAGLPKKWAATKPLQVISFALMVMTGFLVVSCLSPGEPEKTISKLTQMNTIEIIFVAFVIIANVVGIAYIFYATNKEKKVQTNEEEGN